MPFSHFRGRLKSPTRQSRPGDGAPPPPCIDGFTVNGFTLDGFTVNGFTLNRSTVNGFIPPVDGHRHGRSRKSFRMRRYEKSARKSFEIRTCKNKGLKVSWNEQLQKNRGVPPRASLPQWFSLTLNDEVHNVQGTPSR